MIKAASLTFGIALTLTVATTAPAQFEPAAGSDTSTAVQEAVRRQALTLELRQKLAEAQASVQRKDMVAAGKQYEAAYKLTTQIGTGIDPETKAAVAGVVMVSTERARQAQQRGDYREADIQLRHALRADPKNPGLLTLKKENDMHLTSQAGKYPSAEAFDRASVIATNRIANNTLVQDGKLLYELGQWDDAEAKLKQAVAEDPNNQAAFYYLRLIQEARFTAAARFRDVDSGKKIVEIENAWQESVQRELLPMPNPFARTNLIHTSAGRQAIVSKLNRITFSDEVKYDNLELSEVIRDLSDKAKKRDPDKQGINFIILPDTSTPVAAVPTVDPNTGQPVPVAAGEAVDVNTIRIKINPPLSNLRLADVLDAVVRTAEKPIKYSVEDYAVVISLKPAEVPQLYTRTFKVDPNTFYQGLESVGSISFGGFATGSGGGGGNTGGGGGGNTGGGGGSGNSSDSASIPRVFAAGSGGGGGGGGGNTGGGGGGDGISFVTRTNNLEGVQQAVRAFFTAAGVDLAPPKAVFFNDRKGQLFVRATLEDLDIIEAAIQTLNVTPPQVNIKARMAVVTQLDSKALGFDWYLGQTGSGNDSIGLQGGTAPSYSGSDPFGLNGPSTIFPNPAIPRLATDGLVTSGLRNSAPAVGTITGILTDPQFRVVIHALENRSGVDVLSAPEVTTVSGRQAQIQVVDIRTIVTGINAQQTAAQGDPNAVGGGGGGVGSTLQPTTTTFPFGPTLDVVPYVSADEYTVQMTIIPTVTEFAGYDQSDFTVQAQGTTAGGTLDQSVPLPRIRTQQVTTSCVVWDGQTVVLGGLISESVVKTKDKVPVLGDMPMVGRMFRSEQSVTEKKNLLIFVTPTIIDPAGNRLHSPEEMPFAQNAVLPLQRPAAAQP